MTDSTNASGNAPPASPTPAPPGAQPTTPAPDPARAVDGRFEPNQWRYPADYPVAYLRSKTAEEAAKITDMLYQDMLKNQPQGQQSSPRPVGPAPRTDRTSRSR